MDIMSKQALVVTPKSLCPHIPNFPVELIENQFSVGSLRQSGLANVGIIHWDVYRDRTGKGAEDYIIDYCEVNSPDVVVFGAQPKHYSVFDILKVASAIKVPKVHLWWDHISPDNRKVAYTVGQHMTLNIVMDTEIQLPEIVCGNYFTKWYPIDSSLYDLHSLDDVERDIDVSFVGTVVPALKQRTECLSYLAEEGIKVHLNSGAYSSTPLTLWEYVQILRRSKIVLGFTYLDLYGENQCKSRTFEATCAGAMLLESENHHTRDFFKPYVDFVPFRDKYDLKDKILYYLKNEEHRRLIAYSGHKKQRQRYNEINFWIEIFDLLKIDMSC